MSVTALGGGGTGGAAAAADAGASGDEGAAITPDGLRKTFSAYGVQFGAGSGVSYNQAISKLIVRNTPAELQKIKDVLAQISVDAEQVTIEAKFVEVELTNMEELGFDWLLTNGQLSNVYNPATPGPKLNGDNIAPLAQGGTASTLSAGLRAASSASNPFGLSASPVDSILGINSVLGSAQFNTVIHALSQSGNNNLLSAPKVTAMSGNEAVLEMVEKRYFPTDWREPRMNVIGTNAVGGVPAVEMVPSSPTFGEPTNIGVILKVTPQVRDKYIIHLKLEPEITEFLGYDTDLNMSMPSPYNGLTRFPDIVYKFQMPRIQSRKVTTEVEIYDGETLVLGGFIKETEVSFMDKIPYLGDVPLLGRLFQSKGSHTIKKNLLIFVTARLVQPTGIPIRAGNTHGVPDFRN